jgi:antitoxin YefM
MRLTLFPLRSVTISSRVSARRVKIRLPLIASWWLLLTTMMVMDETLSLATVKARFSEIVDRVARQQERIVVTRNGKPAAVLVSPDDLESLEETLAIMSDRSLAAQIRESERASRRDEPGASLDELRGDLERRRKRHG